MKPSGAHTHPDHAIVPLVLVAVVVAVGYQAIRAAGHVAGELLRAVLIAAAITAGAVAVAAAGFVVWRIRRRRPVLPRVVVQAAPLPRRIPRSSLPPQIHVHVHGPVTAADLATLSARQPAGLYALRED